MSDRKLSDDASGYLNMLKALLVQQGGSAYLASYQWMQAVKDERELKIEFVPADNQFHLQLVEPQPAADEISAQ